MQQEEAVAPRSPLLRFSANTVLTLPYIHLLYLYRVMYPRWRRQVAPPTDAPPVYKYIFAHRFICSAAAARWETGFCSSEADAIYI